MSYSQPILAFLSLLGAAQVDDEPDEIPIIGRPVDLPFSGASGDFRVSLTAEPTRVAVEGTVRLTLVVTAQGQVAHPPRRIDLNKMPLFRERFHIEDAQAGDERQLPPNRWEFTYRIKPKRAGAVEVPSFHFIFFNPALRLTRKPFQDQPTTPIALTVEPPQAYQVALDAPERFFELAGGPGLLSSDRAWELPTTWYLMAILVLPPLGCVIWYGVWRRQNPDLARQANQKRSRAAREALRRLKSASSLPRKQQATVAASALGNYLRQRFDMTVEDATPAEAGAHLDRARCPLGAQQVTRFLQTCDAVRFQANGAAGDHDLAAVAGQLILAVEAESCPAPP